MSTLPVYLQMKIACISYSPPIYCSRVVGISLFHTQAIFKGNPHYISVQIWCTCIPLCSQFHIILLFVTTLRYVSHISCICIFSKIISYACAMHESVPLVNEFTRYDAHKKKRQLNFSLRSSNVVWVYTSMLTIQHCPTLLYNTQLCVPHILHMNLFQSDLIFMCNTRQYSSG